MRILILFIGLGLFLFSDVSAQQITEGTASMSQGSHNSLSVELRGTNQKDIEKAWSKYAKKFSGKTKRNKKTKEIFTDNGTMKDWGNNDFDMYAKVLPINGGTKLKVWVNLGGAYLTSAAHQKQYQDIEKMLKEFAMSVSTGMIEDELAKEEKILKGLDKDLKKLKKNKDGYLKDIENAKAKIAKAEKEIETNSQEQKTKSEEIGNQKEKVKTIQKKLKSLKK